MPVIKSERSRVYLDERGLIEKIQKTVTMRRHNIPEDPPQLPPSYHPNNQPKAIKPEPPINYTKFNHKSHHSNSTTSIGIFLLVIVIAFSYLYFTQNPNYSKNHQALPLNHESQSFRFTHNIFQQYKKSVQQKSNQEQPIKLTQFLDQYFNSQYNSEQYSKQYKNHMWRQITKQSANYLFNSIACKMETVSGKMICEFL